MGYDELPGKQELADGREYVAKGTARGRYLYIGNWVLGVYWFTGRRAK